MILSFLFRQRTPYDQTTPVGYMATLIVEMCAGIILVTQMSFANTFYVSISWYFDTLGNDIVAMFGQLDKLTQRPTQFRAAFIEAVLMHNAVLK